MEPTVCDICLRITFRHGKIRVMKKDRGGFEDWDICEECGREIVRKNNEKLRREQK